MIKKKSFGQHFLRNKSVIDKIIKEVDFSLADLIIEIGPGEGALTDGISEKLKLKSKFKSKLILIEADRDLIPNLEEKYQEAEIIQVDAVKVDFDELTKGEDWILVSNLPYNAASAILMNALSSKNKPKELIVMVQKEQADRMLAKPGEMGVLSVAAQLYAKSKRLFNVKPGSFSPPPKVDSSVLKMETPGAIENLSNEEIEKVIQLSKIGFSSRRKQLHRNLASAGIASSKEVKKALESLNFKPTIRAQELTIKGWVDLNTVI